MSAQGNNVVFLCLHRVLIDCLGEVKLLCYSFKINVLRYSGSSPE